MAFTKKEQSLLKDMQNEEKLCAEKYRRAAENAHDAKLKHIFEKLEQAEQNHYDTVTQMLNGTVPSLPGQSKMPARGKAAKDLKSSRTPTLWPTVWPPRNLWRACTTPRCSNFQTQRPAAC